MLATLKNNKSIFRWLIYILYVALFFPRVGVTNVALVALLLYCVLNIRPAEIFHVIKTNALAQLLIALYLLQVVGLAYTENYKTGMFMLEKKLCFLLLPIFVFPVAQKLDEADRASVFRGLGYITMLSSVVLLVVATYRKFVLNDPNAFFFESFRAYEGFTSIHYVYYAMYFVCGFFFFIDTWFERLKRMKFGIFLLTLLFAYALGIIVLVASKTGIIIFSLASIAFFYFKIGNKRIFIAAVILLFVSTFVFLLLNDTTRARFAELGDDLSVLKHRVLVDEFKATGLNMRLLFWKISLYHLWQDRLVLTGVGTGDAQDYINSLYNLPEYQLWGYLNWDSHNQWVFALIQLGVTGVAALGLLYYKGFRMTLANGDLKLLCFLITTLGFSMSESVLELNKGIVFFSLMMVLLTAFYSPKKPDPVTA